MTLKTPSPGVRFFCFCVLALPFLALCLADRTSPTRTEAQEHAVAQPVPPGHVPVVAPSAMQAPSAVAASEGRPMSTLMATPEQQRRRPASPEEMNAELQARFDEYDAHLAKEPVTAPAWWGNRNLQADVASVDPMANVVRVHCTTRLCAADVIYQQAPELGAIDEKLLNQPAMQGGLLVQRFKDNPRRLRLYIFQAEMEPLRPGDLRPPPPHGQTTDSS
jgi:hypothetical protein